MTAKKPEHLKDTDLDQVKGATKLGAYEVDHPIFSVEEAFVPTSPSPRLD